MRKISVLFALLLIAYSGMAQKSKSENTITSSIKADQFKGLKWRNIGPFRGGRANTIVGDPLNPMVYYVGYTGGGVGKTDDGGATWKNISDGFFKVGSIGDIAVCESDPNVIYVGTGEHAVRGVMTSYGDGVYKSTDGGKTWKNIGLEKTRHISDVIVHPNNPDVVYVAAQGTVHGPSAERGIYKSVDGGATWKRTLFVDENTDCLKKVIVNQELNISISIDYLKNCIRFQNSIDRHYYVMFNKFKVAIACADAYGQED
ncbi:MAG: WD40/YVTN/BNR-like repeat-containing protein, partial [Cyclobacteriaceae bacterium]